MASGRCRSHSVHPCRVTLFCFKGKSQDEPSPEQAREQESQNKVQQPQRHDRASIKEQGAEEQDYIVDVKYPRVASFVQWCGQVIHRLQAPPPIKYDQIAPGTPRLPVRTDS